MSARIEQSTQEPEQSNAVRRTLLRSAEQRPILLQVEVDLDQLRAGEELHEHAAAPISQL